MGPHPVLPQGSPLIKRITIAIDGPAGAGKSSVARKVAQDLGYTYIDTGAMYRAVAWLGLQHAVPLEDEVGTVELARTAAIRFAPAPDGPQRVYANDTDITEAIREPEVTRLSSPVSAISGVRKLLVAQQQSLGSEGGVVMEGRDIGTVVFPNAQVKVFLTASEEERARRRWLEMQGRGQTADICDVQAQIRERDQRDSSRADSPLCAAQDALVIESDGVPFDAVVRRILDAAAEHSGDLAE